MEEQTKTETRRYKFFHPIYLSLFSKPLYQDVARHWKGYCFAYLFFLVMLSLIPEMARFHTSIVDFVDRTAPGLLDQVPTITISRGEASIDRPSPHSIYSTDNKTALIIIDTSGRTTALDNTTALALLTKTKILFKKDTNETRMFDLKVLDHIVIDRSRVSGWIGIFRDWAALTMFPFVFFAALLLHLVQVFLCASIGRSFARMFDTALDYQALVRLSVIAFTPPAILQITHSILNIEFPYSGPITFLIALGYLYYGVGASSEKEGAKAM